jgi:hypothetical protein
MDKTFTVYTVGELIEALKSFNPTDIFVDAFLETSTLTLNEESITDAISDVKQTACSLSVDNFDPYESKDYDDEEDINSFLEEEDIDCLNDDEFEDFKNN